MNINSDENVWCRRVVRVVTVRVRGFVRLKRRERLTGLPPSGSGSWLLASGSSVANKRERDDGGGPKRHLRGGIKS
jgi:hypothetical protein